MCSSAGSKGKQGEDREKNFFYFHFFLGFPCTVPIQRGLKKIGVGQLPYLPLRGSNPREQSKQSPRLGVSVLLCPLFSYEFSTFQRQVSANADCYYTMSAIKAVLCYVIQFYLIAANIILKMVCRLKSYMESYVWAWKNWSLSSFV